MIFDRRAVRALLPTRNAIELMREVMSAVSAGRIDQQLRSVFPLSGAGDACYSLMPASAPDASCFGVKVISVFPQNFASGRQSHQGAFVLFEREHGTPISFVDAGELTAIRTAAASAGSDRRSGAS